MSEGTPAGRLCGAKLVSIKSMDIKEMINRMENGARLLVEAEEDEKRQQRMRELEVRPRLHYAMFKGSPRIMVIKDGSYQNEWDYGRPFEVIEKYLAMDGLSREEITSFREHFKTLGLVNIYHRGHNMKVSDWNAGFENLSLKLTRKLEMSFLPATNQTFF